MLACSRKDKGEELEKDLQEMTQSNFTSVAISAAWATSIPATHLIMPAFDSAISFLSSNLTNSISFLSSERSDSISFFNSERTDSMYFVRLLSVVFSSKRTDSMNFVRLLSVIFRSFVRLLSVVFRSFFVARFSSMVSRKTSAISFADSSERPVDLRRV